MPRSISFAFLRRWVPIALALIVACGLLAACGSGKKDASGVTDTAAPTETPEIAPTALSGSPRIGEAIWATSIDPETAAPIVAATPVVGDTTIYAVFPILSLPAGSQLVASWYFNDTTLDTLDSAMRIDRDRVSGWVEFHIERTGSEPWPDGAYEIVVTDGTNELQRANITIS
ncbi:MAG TPA: hypothetical protein VFP05_10365 [Thermomicrobiales bacterium]|nr:hypothetical protein [Thermomicrobiales bacterium]